MATLNSLPFDVLFEISQYLDFRSILHLTSTCSALNVTIDPITVATQSAKVAFFLEAERFPQHNDPCRLACFRCWKLLPKDQFGRSQVKDRMGKNSTSGKPLLRSNRFCWDCGANYQLYPEHRSIRKGSYFWYLCYECGEYKMRSQRCVRQEIDEAEWAYKMVKRCGKSIESTTSAIEQLPSTIMERILQRLHYQDSIMLSQTNHHFEAIVSPQSCGLRDKYLFVCERSNALGEPSFLPCFSCFRVLRREKFTRIHQQLKRKEQYRVVRKCRGCLFRAHELSASGRLVLEKTQQVGFCVSCKELKFKDEACAECQEKLIHLRSMGEELRRQRQVTAEQRRLHDLFSEADVCIGELWQLSGMDILI